MTFAVILAAGQGTRFGSDKTQALLGGKPLWRWSFDTFSAHPLIDGVIVVGPEGSLAGGATRQESARLGIAAVPAEAELILIHDAARPLVSEELISAVIAGAQEHGAVTPGVPVVDTLRQGTPSSWELVDRSKTVAVQTPQGFKADVIRRAHELRDEVTDDVELVACLGLPFEVIPGEERNFKITRAEDLVRAQALVGGMEVRTGFGYDIHPFSTDPARELWLGGLNFPGEAALEGHSDADVILHAVTDAVLGAASKGDIGHHFPNTDPGWLGARSSRFVAHAALLVRADGFQIVNVDVTVIAEKPKIGPRRTEMEKAIAAMLGMEDSRVCVKATTNEGLGSIGRGEGIAAHAVATLQRL